MSERGSRFPPGRPRTSRIWTRTRANVCAPESSSRNALLTARIHVFLMTASKRHLQVNDVVCEIEPIVSFVCPDSSHYVHHDGYMAPYPSLPRISRHWITEMPSDIPCCTCQLRCRRRRRGPKRLRSPWPWRAAAAKSPDEHAVAAARHRPPRPVNVVQPQQILAAGGHVREHVVCLISTASLHRLLDSPSLRYTGFEYDVRCTTAKRIFSNCFPLMPVRRSSRALVSLNASPCRRQHRVRLARPAARTALTTNLNGTPCALLGSLLK